MQLELSLSLGPANWLEEMWIEIFDKAKKKGKIFDAKLGDHEFQYALINPQDGYGRDKISTKGYPYIYTGSNVTRHIKDKEKGGCIGTSYGGLAFVLERELARPDFADYVGLHEHIEKLTRDLPEVPCDSNLNRDHAEACKAELGEVLKRESDFVEAYANWIVGITHSMKNPERGYFGRALPDFLRVVKEGGLSPTEVLREFKSQLDAGYHLQ